MNESVNAAEQEKIEFNKQMNESELMSGLN